MPDTLSDMDIYRVLHFPLLFLPNQAPATIPKKQRTPGNAGAPRHL
jgi:hypothetical protein